MRNLGLVFAVILLAIGLQELGAGANRLVMHSNGDRMPVLVVTDLEEIELAFDARHCPLTWKSHYILLSDIAIVPFFNKGHIDWTEESVGDFMMDTGTGIWYVLPFYPLFLLGRWIRRRKC